MRRAGLILLTVCLFGLAIAAFTFVHGWTGNGPAMKNTPFTVAEGATLKGTAKALQKAGVIRSADAFYVRARLLGGSGSVKAGEYLIPRRASARDIFRIITEGIGISRFVTIPEGMPSIMVYDRLMANDELSGAIKVPAEGSVLPDTYAYDKGDTRASVLARMQTAMTQALDEVWAQRGPDTPVKSKKEAVTLASIVEKETAVPSERSMVAGVYANRLRTGMRLQADPTIIYPITKGKPLGRRILRSEIERKNDYNTYAMSGLPKGPIANPSRASLEAAVNPAKTKALYFVANGQGGHVFADTLEEHNRNVKKWYALRQERGN